MSAQPEGCLGDCLLERILPDEHQQDDRHDRQRNQHEEYRSQRIVVGNIDSLTQGVRQ